MVTESLKYFLHPQTSLSLERLDRLLSYRTVAVTLSSEETQQILKALGGLKILDPACGSGAFPMGILQKVTLLLQRVDPACTHWLTNLLAKIPDTTARRFMQEKLQGEKTLWDYTRKLGILRECIYGVDIQTIAVEISRLRCFLSLIVDEQVSDNQANRGIIPLPNLAFKLVCANTLRGISHLDWQLYEPQVRQEVTLLGQLRGEYLNSQGAAKLELQKKFQEVQKSLLDKVLQWAGKDSEVSQLATWKPFEDESCAWFDPFWMFGVKEGFEVVIGNPPYARVQTLQQTQPDQVVFYKKNFTSAKGSFDIYVLFLEKGFSLLDQHGILSYILPHKFFQAKFGETIRKEIAKEKAISQIVRFDAEQVFDEATTYTCLFFISKQKNNNFSFFEVYSLENAREVLAAIQSSKPHTSYQHAIIDAPTSGEWNFTVGDTNKVLEKLRQQSHTLGDITRKIFQGIATSADKIYVLSILEWKEHTLRCFSNVLQREIEIERDFVKPFLMGKNVHRYEPVIAKNVVIFPYQLDKSKPILMSQEFIKHHFPLGWAYLLENKQVLSKRERGRFNDDWHSFSRPQNLTEFEAVKIMTPEIALGGQMSFDETGSMYHTTKVYSFVFTEKVNDNPKYFLGVLNSKLLWFFLSSTGYVLRGGYFTFKTEYLKPFPIPCSLSKTPPTKAQHDEMVRLVDLVLVAKRAIPAIDTTVLEREIDQLVYQLYGLTAEEIKLVENATTNK